MKAFLGRNKWPLLGLSLMVVCVLLCNLFCIPAHDELSYAFAGQNTPKVGECARVASVGDIVRQQIRDYCQGTNGRVFVHGVVALFAGFRLYWLFDVCNTAMWMLLVYLVLREGGVCVRKAWSAFLGAMAVWWFLWYAEPCSMNAAFAVNYLWTAAATVGMMALWRRARQWWLIPIAFVYGWGQEAFALPMVAALAGGTLIRSIAERRLTATAQQMLAWGAMVAGVCLLCFGPAAASRAGGTLGDGGAVLALACVRGWVGLALYSWPAVLLLAVAWVAWRNREGLPAMVLRAPEWWCYLFAAAGLFCLTCEHGVIRLAMPMLLAAMVLALRERAAFRWVGVRARKAFLAVSVAWMVGVAAWQVALGCNQLRMLRAYRQDPQGVTAFAALPTGPLHYSVARGAYTAWHWSLFQREFGLAVPPTVLSPWLYEALYKRPVRFFETAEEIFPGVFVSPRAPRLAVVRGRLVEARQREAAERYLSGAAMRVRGWRRFVPGRFLVMFPTEDFYLHLPSPCMTLVAGDGKPYTLLMAKKP